eukprot:jgi/Hompol1/1579/HPOL_005244-RA
MRSSDGSDGDGSNAAAGRKRPRTTLEAQRQQLERLMQRADKPIVLPKPPSERRSEQPPRPPRAEAPGAVRAQAQVVANSMSIELFVAKRMLGSKRSTTRLKRFGICQMPDARCQMPDERLQKEYEERVQAIRQADAERTNKNREKRLKKKQRQNSKTPKSPEDLVGTDSPARSADQSAGVQQQEEAEAES